MRKNAIIKVIIFSVLLVGLVLLYQAGTVNKGLPVLLILDTDISSDVDDVGAVAVLHSLADEGKAEILAMMVSSGDLWGAPCLDLLNTWFGRPDIPIGMVKGSSVLHESKYTQIMSAEFPHDLKRGDAAPDAVSLYRKVLAAQKDNSVVVVSVGYLTNIKNLLHSPPDKFSPLDGVKLVRQKVKKLICMGGQYPKGREWNFYQDTASTRFVLNNWPSPVTFIGYEAGQNILTGAPLLDVAAENPVRRAYELYNEITDRPSWDQVAVLYAVESNDGDSGVSWSESPFGNNELASDGANQWRQDSKAVRNYLSLDTTPEKTAEIVNRLMLGPVSK